MPDIILPRRLPGLTTRRRSVDAPTAADVPTVNPAVARDPGLKVPEGAFGGGIGEGLESLGGAVSDIARTVARQQKLQDATGKEQSRTDLIQTLRGGLDARAGDQDFTEDPARIEYLGFVDDAVEKSKQRIRQAEGAARISDQAMAALDPELDDIGDTFRLAGDTLHLRGVEQRGVDQLTLAADEAAQRARRFVAASPGDGARYTLGAELALFDDLAHGFRGAFRDDRDRDLRARGRRKIIEAGLTGLAEQGRGADARMLLEHADFADDLDADTRSRLSHDTAVLSDAYDKDQALQATRQAAQETRAKEAAALAFARDFRTRLAAGEATHGEIAAAKTAGALSPGRAAGLRAELAEDQARRQDMDTRTGRITALLDNGNRPDPGSPDDRADVAHHFEATLRPALADMDPARKAAAIGAYARDTGMVPDAALDTLMGLSVTGEATDRIAAAGQMSDMLARYPEIRRRVPPALAGSIRLAIQLHDSYGIPPKQAVATPEILIARHDPNDPEPRPELLMLATANDDVTLQQDGSDLPDRADQTDKTGARSDTGAIPSTMSNQQIAQTGNQAPVGPVPPVPAYRKDVFKDQPGTWNQWDNRVRALHDIGKNEAHAYREIFAAEGGFRHDPTTKDVVAGVTPGTLKTVAKQLEKQGINTSGGPRSIDRKDFPKVYRAILDEALKQVGGSKALEKIPDKTTAAALVDSIFRHGKTGGAQVFQHAINAVSPGAVPVGTTIGPKTFPEIVRLAGDSKSRQPFLDAIATQRKAKVPDQNEWTRFDHFR